MATEQPGLLSTILFPRTAAEKRGQARREEQLSQAAPMINQARFGNAQGSKLALQGLSQIDNPTVQAIGANQAGRLQDAIGNRMTPLQQEVELTSAQNRNFDSQLQPGQLTLQQQAIDANQRVADAAPEPQSLTSYQTINPLTGQPWIGDIAGPAQATQQGGLDASLRALSGANQYMNIVSTNGSEMFGADATRLQQLQFGIMTSSIQMAGAGAPQAAELEMVGRGLPDATSLGQNIRGTVQSIAPGGNALRANQIASISAGYQQYARGVSESIVQQLRINPSLSLTSEQFNQIDPSVWKSPDEKAYYEANTGQGFYRGQVQ